MQQGFDYCYDKRLYDRLLSGSAEEVRLHLLAERTYQNALVRFVENHDEPRAATAFGAGRAQAAAVTALTQTGARLIHHGQLPGWRVRLPVFLGRFPTEPVDDRLAEFYRRLLAAVADQAFGTGTGNCVNGRGGRATTVLSTSSPGAGTDHRSTLAPTDGRSVTLAATGGRAEPVPGLMARDSGIRHLENCLMTKPHNMGQASRAAVVFGGLVASGFLFRRFQLRWGATAAEADGGLPGDDFLPIADLQSTRAITIGAPAEAVWPWLAQMGQGRGGLYSYDLLENLAGLDMHSADRIHPEWQDIEVGDRFRLAPAASADLEVGLVDQGNALVLRAPPGSPPGPYDFSWAFVLQPEPGGVTRLLVRERYACRPWWARCLVEAVEVVSFIMSRRMLQGIRSRAEGRY